MKTKFKSGETVPKSGLYRLIDSSDNSTGKRVTVVKGYPFPPTPHANQGYKLDESAN